MREVSKTGIAHGIGFEDLLTVNTSYNDQGTCAVLPVVHHNLDSDRDSNTSTNTKSTQQGDTLKQESNWKRAGRKDHDVEVKDDPSVSTEGCTM
jgi:hypothetical protein